MTIEGGGAEAAPHPQEGKLERAIERFATILAVIGGLVLIGLALMVSASIFGRWFLGREITGAFEVVQVGVAIAAFLFLPICQLHNHNIIVDSFTTRTSPRFRAGLDALWAFAYAAIALILAWRLAIGAAETIQTRMVTPMLRIEYGWGMVVGTGALCFLALVCALVAFRHIRGMSR